ncbi:MAG: DNA helicase RecQ [Pirellulales bacterium]|nr:DNA helicase RecQ [Pirellulales bacterium]
MNSPQSTSTINASQPAVVAAADLSTAIARHWGFKSLRPLQDAAMRAVLSGQDSLVVLPTGGGKSLCYQAPAVARGDTTVVVSPLISLMKDQVDSLRAVGVPAVALNSSLDASESRAAVHAVRNRQIRLLFVSPERLALDSFRQLLIEIDVQRFALDEAHCISQWGHDFRPEYRQLKFLKQQFPRASVHGFTATATPQVRRDIVEQLGLRQPEVLVGNFDRPNLTYRVVPRSDVYAQTLELIERHRGEAGIVYCIRRRDVDDLTEHLKSAGIDVLPYHAGLDAGTRKSVQTAFKQERCDLVVATVAFGMGIDRSNIRFVLHTGIPKSIEHYQQETGRAGRDGLEAECVLIYSAADVMTWKRLLTKSVAESEQPVAPEYLQSAIRHLNDMDAYCRPLVCRHQSLVKYFGQQYDSGPCQACDVCLEDTLTEPVEDAQTVAKKILSCVGRVDQRFGVSHVVRVLLGDHVAALRSRGHDRLSTFGLLKDCGKNEVRDWVYQLVKLQVLVQTSDEYPVLQLNDASWEVMRDQRKISLVRRHKLAAPTRRSKADVTSWEGVDRELFDALRTLRRGYAEDRGVPPYVIFNDATLREMARVRPSNLEKLRLIYGIGERKLAEFGAAMLAAIDEHCQCRNLSRDRPSAPPATSIIPPKSTGTRPPRIEKQKAKTLFHVGTSVAEVAQKTGRAQSTIYGYLCEYIRDERPASVEPWVQPEVYQLVSATVDRLQAQSLKPVFLALDGKISYDDIRVVMVHRAVQASSTRT